MTTNLISSKHQSIRGRLIMPRHLSEWDDRFWLGKISNVLPEIPLKRAFSGSASTRASIKSAGSLSTNNLLKLRPNTGTMKNAISLEREIFILKNQLDEVWNTKSVPEFHRNLFLTSLSFLKTSNLQLEAIKKESSNIKKNSAPVLCVITAINDRETLLKKLEEKSFEETNKPIFILEIGEMIKNIRQISLEVIDFIKIWRSYLQMPIAKFIWNNEDYFEKMKNDYKFILESPISKIIKFPPNCTTFFIQLKTQRNKNNSQESQNLFKVNPHLQARVLNAHRTLGIEITKLSIKKKRLIRQPKNQAIQLNFNFQISSAEEERPSQWESSESEDEAQHNAILSNDFQEAYLIEISEKMTKDIVRESCREMISASLVLFSSSILDKLITEVLSQQINQVATVAYQETKDGEYIDFQVQILQMAMEEILLDNFNSASSQYLAELISDIYSDDLNFAEIVQEAINEEHNWNVKIIILLFEELITDLLSEEWFEILIEDTLSYTRLDDMWKILPLTAQKQLYKTDREKIHNKIAEDFYFDILNSVVGDIWTFRIVHAVVNEEDDYDIDKILPIKEERTSKKRSTKINYS
ncbi:unnamed protein product [Blepharisma stoltei]|uniref:Uncharacterized protein n=1 Tax=Blepharisma stoltei TaxID=1481888 RepID=A0AAU9JFK1_9CILI|nr:unnamed protein product [Blepharisma stoltei]